jgi:hypothetical protein
MTSLAFVNTIIHTYTHIPNNLPLKNLALSLQGVFFFASLGRTTPFLNLITKHPFIMQLFFLEGKAICCYWCIYLISASFINAMEFYEGGK